jgi:hypothetical protein
VAKWHVYYQPDKRQSEAGQKDGGAALSKETPQYKMNKAA